TVASPTSITVVPRTSSEPGFIPGRSIDVDVILPSGLDLRLRLGFAPLSQRRRDGLRGRLARPRWPAELLFGTIPDTVVTARGVEYWVEVHTVSGRLTFPAQ